MGRPKTRVVRLCQHCGSEFEVHISEIKRGCGKFCSRKCAATYRNTHSNPAWNESVRKKISSNHADVSGDKNPMFGKRGELAPSYIDGRSFFVGEQYRKMLLASGAEYKCTICGSIKRLHAHHLDGNHSNNDIKNLVWLCVNCHNNIAHKYERDSHGRFTGSKVIKL